LKENVNLTSKCLRCCERSNYREIMRGPVILTKCSQVESQTIENKKIREELREI
jgi:hypothetical protein